MALDENTRTTSVGSRDWLEASKELRIQGYLPAVGKVDIITEFLESSTQVTMTGYGIPISVHEDESNPHHREDFDRLLGGMAKSSE